MQVESIAYTSNVGKLKWLLYFEASRVVSLTLSICLEEWCAFFFNEIEKWLSNLRIS